VGALLIITPSDAGGASRSTRFGIAHVGYPGGPRDPERHARAASLGAGWNRWALYWTDVERADGQFDWSGADAIFALDEQYGLGSMPVLVGTPAFHTAAVAASASDRLVAPHLGRSRTPRQAAAAIDPPPSMSLAVFADGTDASAPGKPINAANRWARFVAEAARRYAGRPIAWEIWNEPDFSQFWSGSAAQYARLLTVAHQAIRSQDSTTPIAIGGLMNWEKMNSTGIEHAWLRWLLAELVIDPRAAANNYYFDVIPFHWYSRATDAYDRTVSARQVLAQLGVPPKRIWINEANAPACGEPPAHVSCADAGYRGSATVEEQAAFALQYLALALAANVERAALFQFQDDGHAEAYGLYRNDRTSRPTVRALQIAIDALGDGRLATRDRRGDHERITVLSPRGTATVLWATGGSAVSIGVEAIAPTARLIRQDGTEVTVIPLGGQYRVVLPGATNLRAFSGLPGDFMIGGSVSILHQSRTTQFVDPPAAGTKRLLLPSLGR